MTYNPNAWSALPKEWDNNANLWPRHRLDIINILKPILPSLDSILELACCTGHYIRRLREEGYDGYYVGTDITPRFIERARLLTPDERFLVLDARDLHLHLNLQPDLILAPGLLMHLPLEEGWKAVRSWLDSTKEYLLLSYYHGRKTTESFHTGFFSNRIARGDLEAVLKENERITTYNIVTAFANCLIERENEKM